MIKRIIKANRVASQEELQSFLVAEGYSVTQATLSRDLKLLKVGKVSEGQDGYYYTLPGEDDGIESLAGYAFEVNQKTQNIGARRLYTIMERLLEELSFESPDMAQGRVVINAAYVKQRIDDVSKDEDLSKFIL